MASLLESDVPSIPTARAALPPEAPEAPEAALTIIGPARRWQLLDVRELWQFRELIALLAWRDIQVRYRQTLLGAAWALLQPLLMMGVFVLLFGKVAGDVAYPLYVYLGLLPWSFFATAISSAGNSVVGSERLITKVYFPRLVVPFASVGAAGMDFLVAGLFLGVLMAYYGVAPAGTALLAPLLFALILLCALGVGTLLAALNVAYRDVRHAIPFLIQLWLLATPAIYLAPDKLAELPTPLLALNPLNGFISAFRAAILGEPIPWSAAALAAALSAAVFCAGCLYFRKVEDSFADVI